ncbi:MAG TPA: single-stranded-DNA-specific exonuclease RecJ [Clostridium sp.]|nr:single-stranded-DNA-specific exonuclease RecJ [Clostridium sp.]
MKIKRVWNTSYVPIKKAEKLASDAGISTFLAKIFLSREMDNVEIINKFLNSTLDDLNDPFLLKDMNIAVKRVAKAIEKKEKILIYGDYDVDGVTSTSILYKFLKSQNGNVYYYIPNRFEEGYGFCQSSVEKIIDMQVDLVVTVDCGTTAIEEAKILMEKGIDMVVTDHHECKEELPVVKALVNPQRPDCLYPDKNLSGVGVAFKLIKALSLEMDVEIKQSEFLDLVALGTIADVMPLTGENRILVKFGLEEINNTSNLGLRYLMKDGKIFGKKITSIDIGYIIAPRLNAAGRIKDAAMAVELLTTDDETTAKEIASELSEQNKQRQRIEAEIFEEVISKIEKESYIKKSSIMVVAGKDWHQGVIGIVASKIVEKYNKPCILISVSDGIGKGSGRSIEGLNLFNAITYCQRVLEKFGGHEMAVGLTLKEEKIHDFNKLINEYASTFSDECEYTQKINIDTKIELEEITLENARELNFLEPFGTDNPEPLFKLENAKISDISTVGSDNSHLKLKIENDSYKLDAIAFKKGDLAKVYKKSDVLDIVCTLDINSWNGSESVQLKVRDIKPAFEIILNNKFFFSLDKSLNFEENTTEGNSIEKISSIGGNKNLKEYIYIYNLQNKRIVIMLNSIDTVKEIMNLVKDCAFEFNLKYSMSFSEVKMNNSNLYILVNPDPYRLNLSKFDKVIVYGDWFCEKYLNKVLNSIDLSKIYIYNKINFNFNKESIVPSRQDMVFVYKHLKANYDKSFILDNLFAFSDYISKEYGINMNYFKAKKVIQIFSELSFLKSELYGKYGVIIDMLDTHKQKRNIEDSFLYKSLNDLNF